MLQFFILILTIFILGCTSQQFLASQNASANFNLQLAMLYLQQSNVTMAKSKLLLAQQQMPNSAALMDAFGYFYETTGEADFANHYYEQAIKLAPHSGATQNNFGTFLCRQKKYDQAIQHFILAANDPNYLHTAQAYENASRCALRIPNRQLAEYFLQKARVHLKPNTTSAIQKGRL